MAAQELFFIVILHLQKEQTINKQTKALGPMYLPAILELVFDQLCFRMKRIPGKPIQPNRRVGLTGLIVGQSD